MKVKEEEAAVSLPLSFLLDVFAWAGLLVVRGRGGAGDGKEKLAEQ